MNWIILILTFLGNLSKVFPQWYEAWQKRGDLAYLEERAKIREEKAEAWQKVLEATGDEQEKLLQKYLDKYIRNR